MVRGTSTFGPVSRVLGVRFASSMPPAPWGQYPHPYGSVEETVMSPYKGGPVYLWLRSTLIWTRRILGRHMNRWLMSNWCFQKMAMFGVPEFHIDPVKNRWRFYIDTSYYGG